MRLPDMPSMNGNKGIVYNFDPRGTITSENDRYKIIFSVGGQGKTINITTKQTVDYNTSTNNSGTLPPSSCNATTWYCNGDNTARSTYECSDGEYIENCDYGCEENVSGHAQCMPQCQITAWNCNGNNTQRLNNCQQTEVCQYGCNQGAPGEATCKVASTTQQCVPAKWSCGNLSEGVEGRYSTDQSCPSVTEACQYGCEGSTDNGVCRTTPPPQGD